MSRKLENLLLNVASRDGSSGSGMQTRSAYMDVNIDIVLIYNSFKSWILKFNYSYLQNLSIGENWGNLIFKMGAGQVGIQEMKRPWAN